MEILGYAFLLILSCAMISVCYTCLFKKEDKPITLDNPELIYWIGWEDKKGLRAYTQWSGTDPDEALFTFRQKHWGRRILIISENFFIVQHRVCQYPWENAEDGNWRA